MHDTLKYVRVMKLAVSMQVVCKERLVGMESSKYRDQLDVPLASKNDPIFEEDRNKVSISYSMPDLRYFAIHLFKVYEQSCFTLYIRFMFHFIPW